MAKRKKVSSRRSALSGPTLSPASTHRDPILLEEDGHPSPERQQNCTLIDDETKSQTQNPTFPTEENVKGEDLVVTREKGAILEGWQDTTGEISRKPAPKNKRRRRSGSGKKKRKQLKKAISTDDDNEDCKGDDEKKFPKIPNSVVAIEEENEPILDLVVESRNTQKEEKPELQQDGDLDVELDEKKQEEGQVELEGKAYVSQRTARKKKKQRAVLRENLIQVENPIRFEEDLKETKSTALVENKEDSSKNENPVEEEEVALDSQNTDSMEGDEQVYQSSHGDYMAKDFALEELNHNNEEEKEHQEQGEGEKQIQQEETEGMSVSLLGSPPANDALLLGFDLDNMDYQRNKGLSEWHLNEKSHLNLSYIRRCNLNETQNQETKHVSEDEEGYGLKSKSINLGGLSSADLHGAMGTTSITYSPSSRLHGWSSGDLFHSRVDSHLNPFGDEDIADHHILSGHQNASSMDFNLCVEQISYWLSKAKVMYEEKEQASRSSAAEQLLFSKLQQQNEVLMNNLEKTKYELHWKEMENYKLDQELMSMCKLLNNYRKALKDSSRVFSEYRKRNPEPEEPLYKDAGPGGIVLTVKEIERQRLKREEEEKQQRCMLKQTLNDYDHCLFEELKDATRNLDKRLLECEGNFELLKEISVKRKVELPPWKNNS